MTVQEPISQTTALSRFPELAELVAARHQGWIFRRMLDDNGDLIGIAGSWTRQRYTDAIFVFDRTHIMAARILADGHGDGCVWIRDGNNLQEVVNDLAGLPEPGEPGAPALVIRASSLWTP